MLLTFQVLTNDGIQILKGTFHDKLFSRAVEPFLVGVTHCSTNDIAAVFNRAAPCFFEKGREQ